MAALALATTLVAGAAVEFSAVIQWHGRPRFVLTDRDDDANSEWITLGEEFRGYRIVAYDAKRDVLSVQKDHQALELTLKGSHVAAAVAAVAPDLKERGITPEDLVVRDSGPVRIRLAVGFDRARPERRFIDVNFDNGTDRCGVEFGSEGPRSISRGTVPEAVKSWITDDDISAINAHLAVVRAKWMGER